MLKIAIIGAGSLTFTRRLMMDILVVPEFRNTEFRFMDISEKKLEMTTNICQKMIDDNHVKAKIISTSTRKEAIKDADYVLCVVRVGGEEAYQKDIEIPCYVDQTGIHPVFIGELPLACAATCRSSISIQEMAVEAALTGNKQLVKQAVLHDPLTSAICTTDEVWEMCNEMFDALSPWMPQFKK